MVYRPNKNKFQAAMDSTAVNTGSLGGTMQANDPSGVDLDAPAAEPDAQAPMGNTAGRSADGSITMPTTEVSASNLNTAGDADIDATYKRLNEIMHSVPDVDYEGKYHSLLQQAQNQPTPQAPGKAQSFFAALGSPSAAPDLLAQSHAQAQKALDEKQQRVMSLKEAILHGDIQQQIAKGDFKKALAQSAELEKLHLHQSERARAQAFQTFKDQQDVLQGNRKELEGIKMDAAMARAKAAIDGRKDLAGKDQKEKLQMAHEIAMGASALEVNMGYTFTDAVNMATQSVISAHTTANNAVGGGGNSTPPAPGAAVKMTDGKEVRMVAPDKVEAARKRGFSEAQ
jgi:hypothetical protein